MADGSEESGIKIKIVVKTPKEKKEVDLDSTSTVKEVLFYVAARHVYFS